MDCFRVFLGAKSHRPLAPSLNWHGGTSLACQFQTTSRKDYGVQKIHPGCPDNSRRLRRRVLEGVHRRYARRRLNRQRNAKCFRELRKNIRPAGHQRNGLADLETSLHFEFTNPNFKLLLILCRYGTNRNCNRWQVKCPMYARSALLCQEGSVIAKQSREGEAKPHYCRTSLRNHPGASRHPS
jgi:hypothetical protein